MATMDDARKHGPLTKAYAEKALSKGTPVSHDVFKRAVGMIIRGEGFGEPAPAPGPTHMPPPDEDELVEDAEDD
jgi:hypothetical protein